MDDTPAQPAAVTASDGIIPHDLPCLSCGYNLRTLRIDGFCPECNAPVRDAWHNRTLVLLGSARDVATLRWGAILMLAAYGVPVVTMVVGVLVAYLTSDWLGLDTIIAILVGGACLTLLTDLSGILLMTSVHNSRTNWPSLRLSAALRTTATLYAAGAMALVVSAWMMSDTLFRIAYALVSVAFPLRIFLLYRYLTRLAVHIPDPHLDWHCHKVMWALTVSTAMLTLPFLVVMLDDSFVSTLPRDAIQVMDAVAKVAAVVAVLSQLLALLAHIRLVSYLNTARRHANYDSTADPDQGRTTNA